MGKTKKLAPGIHPDDLEFRSDRKQKFVHPELLHPGTNNFKLSSTSSNGFLPDAPEKG